MEDKMAKQKKIDVPTLVVQSKAKEFAKTIDPDIRMSGEFMAELNEEVAKTINSAIRRCHDNSRKTLRPADL